ncbi:MAG TPA: TMEM165/GDT1 family protein [Thermoplasmata archaeon]
MEGSAAFAAAFGLIALLELGDKTQLLLISLGTKHPPGPVIAGAFLGETAVTAIGVAIGVAAAAIVPFLAIQVASGILFIGIGLWNLRPEREGDPERAPPARGPFLTTTGLSFLAELGDKTMLAVIALSGTLRAPVSVFLGAALGLLAVAVPSVVLGRVLRRYVTAKWLRWVSAGLFIAAGVLTLAEAALGG